MEWPKPTPTLRSTVESAAGWEAQKEGEGVQVVPQMLAAGPVCMSTVRAQPSTPEPAGQQHVFPSHYHPGSAPVRSRCQREMGSLAARWPMVALAMPRLPSLFSKSMGFTCGPGSEGTEQGVWRRVGSRVAGRNGVSLTGQQTAADFTAPSCVRVGAGRRAKPGGPSPPCAAWWRSRPRPQWCAA